MTIKEFLYQWWRIKSVTDRKGNPKHRKEEIYHEQMFCNHFQIEYYDDYNECFSFEFYFTPEFEDGTKFISSGNWRTSPIVEINEIENELQVVTENSIYTFEKVNESVFDWFMRTEVINKLN